MVYPDGWGAGQSPRGFPGVSSDQVLIVTTMLGHRLFENGSPQGLVICDVREQSFELNFASQKVWLLLQRQKVVDDDRVLDAKRKKVHSIDALVAKLARLLVEKLFKAIRLLGQGRGSGKEPAVAESPLEDILEGDAVGAPEVVLRVELTCPLPGDSSFELGCDGTVGFARVISPVQRVVDWECFVDKWVHCLRLQID